MTGKPEADGSHEHAPVMERRAARPAWRILRRFTGSILAAITVLVLTWGAGFLWFIKDAERQSAIPASMEAIGRTDAIVVLTGGSGRLEEGLELLASGRAGKLLVSGVYHGLDVQELLKMARRSPDNLECCITLGYSAESTLGNAHETAGWMREQGLTTLRVVTANYHMRRSLLELSRAMPDIPLIPHPVDPANVHIKEWWKWPGTANLLMNEYSKYVLSRGRYALLDALDAI